MKTLPLILPTFPFFTNLSTHIFTNAIKGHAFTSFVSNISVSYIYIRWVPMCWKSVKRLATTILNRSPHLCILLFYKLVQVQNGAHHNELPGAFWVSITNFDAIIFPPAKVTGSHWNTFPAILRGHWPNSFSGSRYLQKVSLSVRRHLICLRGSRRDSNCSKISKQRLCYSHENALVGVFHSLWLNLLLNGIYNYFLHPQRTCRTSMSPLHLSVWLSNRVQ